MERQSLLVTFALLLVAVRSTRPAPAEVSFAQVAQTKTDTSNAEVAERQRALLTARHSIAEDEARPAYEDGDSHKVLKKLREDFGTLDDSLTDAETNANTAKAAAESWSQALPE